MCLDIPRLLQDLLALVSREGDAHARQQIPGSLEVGIRLLRQIAQAAEMLAEHGRAVAALLGERLEGGGPLGVVFEQRRTLLMGVRRAQRGFDHLVERDLAIISEHLWSLRREQALYGT
jgi:hypothetical protein